MPYIRKWFAILSAPGKEYVVAHVVSRQFGAETYVPTETRWRRKNRYCKAKVEVPFTVTPRYVLAGFAIDIPWLNVLASPGVTGVVRIDGTPLQLDEKSAVMGEGGRPVRLTATMLRRYMEATPNGRLDPSSKTVKTDAHAPAEQRFMRSNREFKAGDMVDVVDGPFRDRTVKVLEISGSIARLDMTLFGGAPVDVPITDLEAA